MTAGAQSGAGGAAAKASKAASAASLSVSAISAGYSKRAIEQQPVRLIAAAVVRAGAVEAADRAVIIEEEADAGKLLGDPRLGRHPRDRA